MKLEKRFIIEPKYKKILDKIRELYVKSGGQLMYRPEDFWIMNGKSQSGIEIIFDYGVPCKMMTPAGTFMVLGSSIMGDSRLFWKLFNQTFKVEIVKKKRNDAVTSGWELQLQYSGPVVRIEEKGD